MTRPRRALLIRATSLKAPSIRAVTTGCIMHGDSAERSSDRPVAWGGISTKRCVGLLFLCHSSTSFQGRLQTTPWTANLQNGFSIQNRFVDNNRSCRQSPSGTQTSFVDENRFCSLRIKGRASNPFADGPQFVDSDQFVDSPTGCRLGPFCRLEPFCRLAGQV
jgi:hypothetical protein